MDNRTKYLFIVLLTFYSLGTSAQQQPVELVESIPDETTLDNPDIRNTKEVWLELINNAKLTLDIETYYISNKEGEPLQEIISAIQVAAKRGVIVRIISDSKFYKTYPHTLDQLKSEHNIAVRIINFHKVMDGVMHAKYFIIDGTVTFLGSQNFDWRSLKHIHEIGIVIRDERVAMTYSQVFNLDWEYCDSNSKDVALQKLIKPDIKYPISLLIDSTTVLLTPTASPTEFIPDQKLWDETAIIRLIDQASKEICIQVMTYSAQGHDRKTYYDKIENALRRAATRGVKVKLLAADWSTSKPKIDYLKSLAALQNIDVKISTIPQHSSGFITYARVEHCKYMVVDSKSFWIGTSNWEQDYFYNSRNVGVVIDGAQISEKLREVFRKSWESRYAQTIQLEKKYIPPKRDDSSGE